uniref:Uncharacterized protein n=1 Tax=Ditylenchus dipsaci TaxID=166011 RepID=A0A915EA54_9BILA
MALALKSHTPPLSHNQASRHSQRYAPYFKHQNTPNNNGSNSLHRQQCGQQVYTKQWEEAKQRGYSSTPNQYSQQQHHHQQYMQPHPNHNHPYYLAKHRPLAPSASYPAFYGASSAQINQCTSETTATVEYVSMPQEKQQKFCKPENSEGCADENEYKTAASVLEEFNRASLLKLITKEVVSPVMEYTCELLSQPESYAHIVSWTHNKWEFKVKLARAFKCFETHFYGGYVVLRKVKAKRNHFEFFPDLDSNELPEKE